MTQFKSKFGFCLTATKGQNNVTSDVCGKEGTNWSIVGNYGNCTIQSQYNVCLAVFGNGPLIIIENCEQQVTTKWDLVNNFIKSNYLQKIQKYPCLTASSDSGSRVTSDSCDNPGAIWSWAGLEEETAEIAKTNSESLLIGEDASNNITIF